MHALVFSLIHTKGDPSENAAREMGVEAQAFQKGGGGGGNIQSISKYSLSAYFMPGTFLGTRDTGVKKKIIPIIKEVIF